MVQSFKTHETSSQIKKTLMTEQFIAIIVMRQVACLWAWDDTLGVSAGNSNAVKVSTSGPKFPVFSTTTESIGVCGGKTT
jgi:uncharacterized protein involved in tolerance to divalent cations